MWILALLHLRLSLIRGLFSLWLNIAAKQQHQVSQPARKMIKEPYTMQRFYSLLLSPSAKGSWLEIKILFRVLLLFLLLCYPLGLSKIKLAPCICPELSNLDSIPVLIQGTSPERLTSQCKPHKSCARTLFVYFIVAREKRNYWHIMPQSRISILYDNGMGQSVEFCPITVVI